MYKNEKCIRKACETIDFRCGICKCVTLLSSSSWWLLKVPYENFTSSFGRLSQKIAPKSVLHVQHDYFSSFNQSKHWLIDWFIIYLFNQFAKKGRWQHNRTLSPLQGVSPTKIWFVVLSLPFPLLFLKLSKSGYEVAEKVESSRAGLETLKFRLHSSVVHLGNHWLRIIETNTFLRWALTIVRASRV